jgi:thiol-disulfide isomerase/thioredoxin
MQDVDSALSNGPVFLEFGASWCEYCQEEKPIIQNLEKKYGSVTFINVDSDTDWKLDGQFIVNGIPQMDLIVRKNPDGSYLYVDAYGNTTIDMPPSRIIGYTEESDLEKVLDAAIAARESGS